jgi:hypothetical protein
LKGVFVKRALSFGGICGKSVLMDPEKEIGQTMKSKITLIRGNVKSCCGGGSYKERSSIFDKASDLGRRKSSHKSGFSLSYGLACIKPFLDPR